MENRGVSMVPGVWRSLKKGEWSASGFLIVIMEGGVVREPGNMFLRLGASGERRRDGCVTRFMFIST
jgi:hypothetical protein